MQRYEYKVIPAPKRGEKLRGIKTTEDRFAQTLTQLMNSLGAEGWDYVRADTLPCDERTGLTGTKTTYQNMLVFRRALTEGTLTAGAMTAGAMTEGAMTTRDGTTRDGTAQEPPEKTPAFSTLRAMPEAELPQLKLGAAHVPLGPAPAIGPAKSEIAAE